FEAVTKAHREIERYHDLRSIVVDETHTVLVAEIELREEAMLAGLRDRIDRHERVLIEAVPESRREDAGLRGYAADRAAVQATLERTEELIDELEAHLKELCPRVSHVTIEVQGIIDNPSSTLNAEFTELNHI
ncbi:MAG: hypothetical protein ACO3TX_12820, partial [Pseudomonadales bacterium]